MAAKSCQSGRSVELREGGDPVVIRFPYDTALVAVVRGLSRRRFDQRAKCWSCPADAIVEAVDTLLPHGFEVAASARALYVARGGRSEFLPGPSAPDPRPTTKCTATPPPAPTGDASSP